jgi:hypothetical protein
MKHFWFLALSVAIRTVHRITIHAFCVWRGKPSMPFSYRYETCVRDRAVGWRGYDGVYWVRWRSMFMFGMFGILSPSQTVHGGG